VTVRKLLENRRVNIALSMLVLAIWGFAFVFIRLAVREIPPSSLAFLRFTVAYIVLLFVPTKKPANLSFALNVRIFVLGFFGVALYFIFENWGLVYTTATNASILVSLIPVLTLIGAVVFFRERYNVWNVVGIVISFAGGALIIWNGKVNFHLNPIGDFFILICSLSWTIYTLLSRNILKDTSPLFVSRRMILAGCLFLLPIFLWELTHGKLDHISRMTVMSILYLGVLSSALAYVIWNQAIRVLGVVFVTNLIYLQCIFTMLAAGVTIHEKITLLLIGFTAIVIVGVTLANAPSGRIKDVPIPPD
jgi:drug/metabolite transporter (DMT)-like permease